MIQKHQFNGNKKSHLVDNEDHQKGDKVKCRETVPAPVSTVTNSTILGMGTVNGGTYCLSSYT